MVRVKQINRLKELEDGEEEINKEREEEVCEEKY